MRMEKNWNVGGEIPLFPPLVKGEVKGDL